MYILWLLILNMFYTHNGCTKLNEFKFRENITFYNNYNTRRSNADTHFSWSQYHSLNEMYSWMIKVSQLSSKVSLLNIGRSYENRDILGVEILFNTSNKYIFLEGGIHGREWISSATVSFILNELINNKNKVMENYNWYIFPVINPDGYEYSRAVDRRWRKNRQPSSQLCTGVDLNRNFGFQWMNGGASCIPCDENFAGFIPFSEPETKSLSKFIKSIHANLIGYISFHSYGQKLLIPYGHTNFRLDNYYELISIGHKAIRSLAKRFGTKYIVGNVVDIIYIASGNSIDWVKSTYHVPITFSYELRDTGINGFRLPPEEIIPTGLETFDSLLTIVQEAKNRGY